jgi:hypothetical protein
MLDGYGVNGTSTRYPLMLNRKFTSPPIPVPPPTPKPVMGPESA